MTRLSNPGGRLHTTRLEIGDAIRHCQVDPVGIIQPSKRERQKRHKDPTVLALRLARTQKEKQYLSNRNLSGPCDDVADSRKHTTIPKSDIRMTRDLAAVVHTSSHLKAQRRNISPFLRVQVVLLNHVQTRSVYHIGTCILRVLCFNLRTREAIRRQPDGKSRRRVDCTLQASSLHPNETRTQSNDPPPTATLCCARL